MTEKTARWPAVQSSLVQTNTSQYGVPYQTADPFYGKEDVNWRWVALWEQENPNPGGKSPDFDYWYAELKKQTDRAWVAWVFPQFDVWDWDDDDVALARKICSRHVCGVCGRSDDPGCVYGC